MASSGLLLPWTTLLLLVLLRISLQSGAEESPWPFLHQKVEQLRSSDAADLMNIWPFPAEVERGELKVRVNPALKLEVVSQGKEGSSATISAGFLRYRSIVFQHQDSGNRATADSKPWLEKLLIHVATADEALRLNTSEAYLLQVPHTSDPSAAYIQADTVYGVLRALETLSQLCVFNFSSQAVEVSGAPWRVKDSPRFPYRGLLIDTGRHFLPLVSIKAVLDAMSFTKLNVLHWHLVDHESFPLQIPSRPELWKGAFSLQERYTVGDVKEVVEYARARGIHVMPEVDVPGHARSWGIGYPDLWPSPSCRQPLDISKEETFLTLASILKDLRAIFYFDFFHLGGDEVDTSCWEEVPGIKAWLQEQGMSARDAYAAFVLHAQEIAVTLGWDPVNWEEPFVEFPASSLHARAVVQNWRVPGLAPLVVKAGFRCIVSNQDAWYLDHLDVPWEAFYNNEPLAGIQEEAQMKLVLGGEVCMWGETVDASDIHQTIWPRAAAAAERLWSPRSTVDAGPEEAFHRFQYFRCLLNQRGVAAAPVRSVFARGAPQGPGSCYETF